MSISVSSVVKRLILRQAQNADPRSCSTISGRPCSSVAVSKLSMTTPACSLGPPILHVRCVYELTYASVCVQFHIHGIYQMAQLPVKPSTLTAMVSERRITTIERTMR
jgi:hypothetical protein